MRICGSVQRRRLHRLRGRVVGRVGRLVAGGDDTQLLRVLRLLLREDVTQEALGPVVLRVEEDLARRSLLYEVALIHVHHAVGDVAAETHLVTHHDHRHAAGGEVLHDLEHLADEFRVQCARGFVEEHEHGLHGHRPGDGHALLLTARQLAGKVVHTLCQPDLGEQVVRLADGLFLLLALHHDRAFGDVLRRILVREEVELLEHHAALHADLVDRLLEGGPMTTAGDMHAADGDLAGRRVLQEVEAAQERALTRPRGADEHHDLALVDLEVDAPEHVVLAEVLVQAFDLDDGLAADGMASAGADVRLGSGHASSSPFPSRAPCPAPCASRAWPARS